MIAEGILIPQLSGQGGDTNAPGMMDPGGDGILKVIDGHGNGCHGFHIVCKSEEAPFICPREVVGDSIISCQVHDVSPRVSRANSRKS